MPSYKPYPNPWSKEHQHETHSTGVLRSQRTFPAAANPDVNPTIFSSFLTVSSPYNRGILCTSRANPCVYAPGAASPIPMTFASPFPDVATSSANRSSLSAPLCFLATRASLDPPASPLEEPTDNDDADGGAAARARLLDAAEWLPGP